MEEREDVRDLRGRRSEPPPPPPLPSFSKPFFLPWNEWPENERLFLDGPPWLAIFNSLNYSEKTISQSSSSLSSSNRRRFEQRYTTERLASQRYKIRKKKLRLHWKLPKQSSSSPTESYGCYLCDKDATKTGQLDFLGNRSRKIWKRKMKERESKNAKCKSKK